MEVCDPKGETEREHQELLVECEALQPILKDDVAADLPHWVSRCRDHFHRLHVYLREHMYREESGGFMKSVLDHRPTLNNKVNRLKQEHLDLRKECEHIESTLLHDETITQEIAFDLIGRIEALIQQIREHERAENQLLLDAFFDDIGTKD